MAPPPVPALRVCYRCGTEAGIDDRRCRHCSADALRTPSQIRGLGWMLLGCGVFLLLVMGTVTVFVTQIVLNSGKPGSTTRFAGDRNALVFIYAIFGLVLAFGAASFWAGLQQIRTARRSRGLVSMMLVIAGILYVIGLVVQWLD